MWYTGFDRVPDARQVDVDHVLPVVLAGLVERVSAIADTRVGDDDVQAAKLLDTAVDGGSQRLEIAHVDLGRDDATVLCLDQIGGLGQVVWCRRGDLAAAADRLADVDRDD